jgi:VWFA-related protein
MRNTFLFLIFSFTIAGYSQSTQPSDTPQTGQVYQSQTVLRATTRLVVLDVVATDATGHPITDLKPEDFTVFEDGKQQKLIDFSFQQAKMTQLPAQHLPGGIVTNRPEYSSASSLNIILLDAINTDFSSHAYAQDMLIKYLGTDPKIQPTAVFALESKLILLHDFTTDTKTLRDVLAHYKASGPSHLPTVEAAASAVFNQRGSFQTTHQGRMAAFAGMRFLARSLAGYPGRKNLIWLSEGFPLNLFPDALMGDGVLVTEDYSPLVEEIADELMNAQVAVYPIDAAGVAMSDRFPAQTAMQSISERTGGKTFFNRNDIDVGVRTSIDDGSTYYAMQYYPENRVWDRKFRKIEVKVDRPGVKLQYRRGYYALGPSREGNNAISEDFSRALDVNAPASAGVLFQASVVVPNDKSNKVVVKFAIDPHTITFENSGDGQRHASLNCVVWAYRGGKGDPVRVDGGTITANIAPDVYEKIMKSYIPCERSAVLKPGNYTLRMGVIDRTTALIGSTSQQVSVP